MFLMFSDEKLFTLHRDASTKSPPLVCRVQSTVDEIVRAALRLSGRKKRSGFSQQFIISFRVILYLAILFCVGGEPRSRIFFNAKFRKILSLFFS
mmetsp:Transcript_5982/g.17611  ORF Transcript_5982/g.17611 Transcript_5982/m.17611 type:complete len:95 (-) Transcript_5982:535-819(-)